MFLSQFFLSLYNHIIYKFLFFFKFFQIFSLHRATILKFLLHTVLRVNWDTRLFCAPLDGRPSTTNFATRTSSLSLVSRIFNTSHERGCYRALVKRGVHKRGLNTGRRMGFNGVVPFITGEICLISLGPCSPIMFAETNSWVIHVSRRGEFGATAELWRQRNFIVIR